MDATRGFIVRWEQPRPEHVALLRQAGIQSVLVEGDDTAFQAACRAAGIEVVAASSLPSSVLRQGLWPGIRSAPNVEGRGDETASASREPWVDANGYLYDYLRTLDPARVPVLGYLPDDEAGVTPERLIPYETLELALIEARSHGGNYVLALEKRYREALLAGKPQAVECWKRLGRTARWLDEHRRWFGHPALPVVTALVEDGHETAELVNLMMRRNVSPAMSRADAPPAPSAQCKLIVAANLKPPTPAVQARILAHAEAGAAVMVATDEKHAWWKVAALTKLKDQEDREFFALGRGRVVAYKSEIGDPSEFALDVIDVLEHRHRAVRLWNAPAAIGRATTAPGGGALLHVINYGSPVDLDTQARIQGHYRRAVLMAPGEPAKELPTARRGSTTEVQIPALERFVLVAFS